MADGRRRRPREGASTGLMFGTVALLVAVLAVAAWPAADTLRAYEPVPGPGDPPGGGTAPSAPPSAVQAPPGAGAPKPAGPAEAAPPAPAPSQPKPAAPSSQPAGDQPAPLPAPPAATPPPAPTVAPAVLDAPGLQPPQAGPVPAPVRFQFKIAPDTPLKDLLPVPPRVQKPAGPVLSEDLAQVPEVEFQAPPAKELANEEALKASAHTMAKINHLNTRKTDGFMSALRFERSDLAGLPFAMGDACRTKGERSRQFAAAVNLVRSALQQANGGQVAFVPTNGGTAVATAPGGGVTGFWDQFQALCSQQDQQTSRVDRKLQEYVTLARIAALVQILAPETPEVRLGLVKYLSGVAHAEATRALARLAIFAPEEEVRQAAVDALKVRRERDYTEVLLEGLRYPWPAVARRAADAAVKLERADLVPQLVALLEEPDPRAPVLRETDGKKVPVVREMVRLNHHKSCLMCHAPGNTDKVSPDAVTAPVPIPGQPLPTPSQGYGAITTPDTLVRVDVTYLRQDFSVLEPVADANPWPEMQRFDFLVRTRTLTGDEAAAYGEKLDVHEPGRRSPYQRAVLTALRELTGKDTEPSGEAWRRLLDLSAKRQ